LIEPYILIVLAMILSASNSLLWWILFDEGFNQRLELDAEARRERMKKENEEFISKMQGIIELDPDAVEVVGFGETWKKELAEINMLKEEAKRLQRRTVWVNYFTLATIIFAAVGLKLPDGVSITDSFTLYFTAISWWMLIIGVQVIIGLLIHYQLIKNRSEPRPEGEAINDYSTLDSIIRWLKSRLPH